MDDDRRQGPVAAAGRPGGRAGAAGLREVRGREVEDAGAEGPEAAHGRRAQEAVQERVRPAQARRHAVPDPGRVGPAGGREARHQGEAGRAPEGARGPEEAGLPERQAVPAVPEDLGHDRGRRALPREAQRAPAAADAEGHPGRHEGLRRGHLRVLRQEQEALRPAGAPRPARRAHQDRGQGQPGEEGARLRRARSSRSSRSTRSTRPRSRRAACSRPCQRASRRRPSTPRSSTPRRVKIEGPVKTQFGWYVFEVEKVTEASQQTLDESKDTIKNLLRSQRQQKALDEFVKRFRERLQGRDELRGRLPRGGVQERSEGRVGHRPGVGRQSAAARPAAAARAADADAAPTPQDQQP